MKLDDEGKSDQGQTTKIAHWLMALFPLILLVCLVGFIVWSEPGNTIRGDRFPVTRITFQSVDLSSDGIVVTVLNDGPDPVTIAQVQVDEAFWSFTSDSGQVLKHLGRATLTIPYPWVEGDAHVVRVVTSTGVTFDHEIAVAVETPRPGMRYFFAFTLIGVYVGVIPVAIGLLWFPLVSKLSRTGLDFLLALTIGLLLFLLVDTGHEGFEVALLLPESFQGVVLFVFGALGAFVSLEMLAGWLRSKRRITSDDSHGTGWVMALMVAIGIGLHNFGEGLAIGAAFALGEAALGSVLIIGFTLHNTTEGLAILAPLARERIRAMDLIRLGLIGGIPTIGGAWLGGFVYSPVWSVLFLAIGAGAIAQVVLQISRQMVSAQPTSRYLANVPAIAGLFAGFGIMYVTGMFVG